MIVKNKKITLSVDESNNCSFAPSDARTVAILSGINGDVTFIVDTTDCNVGDELVLILNKQSEASWQFHFLKENGLFFTTCGSVEEGTFTPSDSRWVGRFYFDGTYFLNTYDDC